jgi:hypothetical protein
MDAIESEPVRLYLEHRVLIEQWAALKPEVQRVTSEAIADVTAELLHTPPFAGLPALMTDPSGYGITAWHRPRWIGDDGVPQLAIGVGWGVNKPSFYEQGSQPWVGIWRGQPKGDELAARARQAAEPLLGELGYRRSTWDLWPVYGWVPLAEGAVWEDLTTWNAQFRGRCSRPGIA